MMDTGFLITLFDANREAHEHAKAYYRYFLEKGIPLYLPTVVASEFCIKQPITDLPLHNFKILPFNLAESIRCAELNVTYYRKKSGEGQRDAVKDDFKIIAQAEEQEALFLLTEDSNSMSVYCELLRNDRKIDFKVIELTKGFDVSHINGNGQTEMKV
ncbi:MAG: hypothetical protein WC334_08305 [Kiritimatiellales bacterium]